MQKIKGDESGYGIIHEKFVEREQPNRCFYRQEITKREWEQMTSPGDMRWWGARGQIYAHTELAHGIIGYSRRRWGDNLKIIDRWHVVKAGTKFEPIDKEIDEVK